VLSSVMLTVKDLSGFSLRGRCYYMLRAGSLPRLFDRVGKTDQLIFLRILAFHFLGSWHSISLLPSLPSHGHSPGNIVFPTIRGGPFPSVRKVKEGEGGWVCHKVASSASARLRKPKTCLVYPTVLSADHALRPSSPRPMHVIAYP
jgi:hypothetical protein